MNYIMKETQKDFEINLPNIEDMEPSIAIPHLCGIIRKCFTQINQLKEEKQLLKAEIKDLKSRMNMDSHNSSKPQKERSKKAEQDKKPAGQAIGQLSRVEIKNAPYMWKFRDVITDDGIF